MVTFFITDMCIGLALFGGAVGPSKPPQWAYPRMPNLCLPRLEYIFRRAELPKPGGKLLGRAWLIVFQPPYNIMARYCVELSTPALPALPML